MLKTEIVNACQMITFHLHLLLKVTEYELEINYLILKIQQQKTPFF